jgi:hypothetical protein
MEAVSLRGFKFGSSVFKHFGTFALTCLAWIF